MAGANPKFEFKLQVFNFTNCYSGICSPSSPRATWHVDGAPNTSVTTTVTDLASAAGGMKVDVTRTTSTDFSVTLTPLANPSTAFTTTGTFANPSFPIDWFQFETFNGIESDAGSPVNGDFNGNGKVDAADYVWLRQNGNPPEDFALWRSAFDNSGGAHDNGNRLLYTKHVNYCRYRKRLRSGPRAWHDFLCHGFGWRRRQRGQTPSLISNNNR